MTDTATLHTTETVMATSGPIGLASTEAQVLAAVAQRERWTTFTVTRQSPRLFDLKIEGLYRAKGMKPSEPPYQFSAWLPLSILHALKGPDYAIAVRMSDYPEMAGDWSGIRDSSVETIWTMVEKLWPRIL